ncbi:hypothetical protein GUITHDRAFT_109104 [Guillardia theta CCMP2712]|uniref:Methyltransferase domain-containing protein n=1 Tax=Guillardia theta (strain CCMP2712) TaxID=905079 RepID=L1JAE2_GUITC|nr:hypothetical protein GUITHDRAFT_109104 [Guillardia theta CCMP2712]EKX45060.1 hypothetical protein GUITHDRAFT_109104 [Guillardia theta CCMP2712]|eukprot:XP_005832040.1 hypothetical protein GUITHDRAFT_109104 [Guillardia theta CCMP2712]
MSYRPFQHVAFEDDQEGEEERASRLERAELSMRRLLANQIRDIYALLNSMKGLPDDEGLKALIADAELATFTAFQREISDLHESMQDMFVQKLRDQIETRRTEIQNDVNQQIMTQRRRYLSIMRAWERRKSETSARKLSKHFHVGCKPSIADWTCMQISPGVSPLPLWLARLRCNVVGLDADEEIVYRAQHRAASAGLIERCVFVKGELSRLAREEPFSFLDVKRALKRFVSGGFAEYSDVVMRMLEQEAQGLTPAAAQHTSCKTLILQHILLEQRIRDESRPLSPAVPQQKTKSFNGDFDLVVVLDAGSAASILESPEQLEGMRKMIKPGGLLFLLCGNNREPSDGVPSFSKQQVCMQFARSFDQEEIFETRFDMEQDPSFSSKPVLAWCALFRRRLELDARSWRSVEDAWGELNEALRPRAAAAVSFDSLIDLLLRDACQVQRPLTIAAMNWLRRLQDVAEQTRRDKLFKDGREIGVVLYD